jgi:hypothetical protein
MHPLLFQAMFPLLRLRTVTKDPAASCPAVTTKEPTITAWLNPSPGVAFQTRLPVVAF